MEGGANAGGVGPDQPTHQAWLTRELLDLLEFGREVAHPDGGAAVLGDGGAPQLDQPVQLWITARMVHVYGVGALLGVPGTRPVAEAVFAGLTDRLVDAEHGGWHSAVTAAGPTPAGKSCYDHAFVLLAAATATVAGLPDADRVLATAQSVFLERFWDESEGMCVDSWDPAWSRVEPYRGINANMHAVEGMLAVADATGDRAWVDRAARIGRRLVGIARAHEWRIPEHYDEAWTPDLDFNLRQPADPFKPYGATVGHGLEWARLLLQLEATLADDDRAWIAAAIQLFDRAVVDGWAADGRPGFVYTTDWTGKPVVPARMHWVAAEASAAAAALWRRTGDPRYADWYARVWDYIDRYLRDRVGGSWWHELDQDNRPASGTWAGKPDLYHAVQATLLPRLPVAPSLAVAVSEGLLRA